MEIFHIFEKIFFNVICYRCVICGKGFMFEQVSNLLFQYAKPLSNPEQLFHQKWQWIPKHHQWEAWEEGPPMNLQEWYARNSQRLGSGKLLLLRMFLNFKATFKKYFFNPFPHVDAFWCLCCRGLFENMATKEEIAQNDIQLLFFHLKGFSYMFSKSSAEDLLFVGKG